MTTRAAESPADASASGELDPGLVAVVESITRRLQAGENVDAEELAAEHPAWAGMLRGLLPTLRELARLGVATGTGTGVDGLAGREFGEFRIVREVGRGGMGVVYEAEQVSLGRRVALKVLPPAIALDTRAMQRFQLEAQVAGWLQHPRIVPVHSVGVVDGVPYYTMPFIEGGSLAALIGELRGGLGLSHLAVGLLSGRFAPSRSEPKPGVEVAPASAVDLTGVRSRAYLGNVVRLGIQAAEALGLCA